MGAHWSGFYSYIVAKLRKLLTDPDVNLTREQLENYQKATYFKKKDIIRIYKRFIELFDGDMLPPTDEIIISHAAILGMPEFKQNPFGPRLLVLFSTNDDQSMNFDEFLFMLSVFSERAPRQLKASFAFKLYDFDGDNLLTRSDMMKLLKTISRNQLTSEEIDFVTDKVLEEVDTNFDDHIAYSEFQELVSRAPDFVSTFRIRI